MNSKKIAVVGGGIFGVTAAIKLAERGYQVDLFEQNEDILQSASGVNQFRLHRGYHYPRSPETISSCLEAEPKFRKEYPNAIIKDHEHYYCVAQEKSLTSRGEFLNRLDDFGLEHKEEYPDVVKKDETSLCVKVREYLIDHKKLKSICCERLKHAGVQIYLKQLVKKENLHDYDYRIFATYSNLNKLLEDSQNDYKFELCEKLVLDLPDKYQNKSVVIMDGPFMCIDPLGESGSFLMGNVVHAIHHTNIGKYPEIPHEFEGLLNNGIIQNPPISNFDKFIESASQFFKDIKKAKHIGSMYTFRTVLPNKEKTDARPTLVNQVDNSTFTVFSGKIGNCVQAAEDILQMVEKPNSQSVFSPDLKSRLL